MSGKPEGEVPKEKISATIDKTLRDLLAREPNQSAFLEELLRACYSKSLEQLLDEQSAKRKEQEEQTIYYSCPSCKKSSFKKEWLNKRGLCPKCGASYLLNYFINHFPEAVE